MSTHQPRWQPTATARRCRCGAHVSATFARVYADDDGEIHACHECAHQGAIMHGAATDPAVPRRMRAVRAMEGDR